MTTRRDQHASDPASGLPSAWSRPAAKGAALPRLLRGVLTGAVVALVALPAVAKAPEASPRPKWRVGTAAAIEAPSAVTPDLPQDPVPGRIDAAQLPARQASIAAPFLALLPAETPEVAAGPVRPMTGPLPDGTAQALERSPRPKWRPQTGPAPQAEVAVAEVAVFSAPRPKLRPKGLAKAAQAERTAQVEQASLRIAPPDPGPKIEPKSKKGGLCGIAGLTGAKLTPIAAGGCGISDPVRLTAVNGVALSAPATMDCATAKALSSWVDRVLVPTVGGTGGGVKRIDVAGSYTCRPRNNQKGQKLSEHGRGKAIDITAIQLKNGSTMSVLHHWNDRKSGPILKALHRGACGPFGTVLGPNANAFHRDHFHFDTASYRNGAYCK